MGAARATWLRTGVELARESSKDSGKALVFFEGGGVSLVRRAAYDWLFTEEQYSPDPYQREPAFFSPARIRAVGGVKKWLGRMPGELWARFVARFDPPSSYAPHLRQGSGGQEASGDRSEDRSSRVVHLRPPPSHPPSQSSSAKASADKELRRDEERERADKKPDG